MTLILRVFLLFLSIWTVHAAFVGVPRHNWTGNRTVTQMRHPIPCQGMPTHVVAHSVELDRLVAPYRAILRYYRCDTPNRAILSREFNSPPKWCDTPPPWHLVSHRHICAMPNFATYRAIIVQYPIKNEHGKILRYYRYKYCAVWKVSLLGL